MKHCLMTLEEAREVVENYEYDRGPKVIMWKEYSQACELIHAHSMAILRAQVKAIGVAETEMGSANEGTGNLDLGDETAVFQPKPSSTVLDADEEFRTVLNRLKNVADDPTKNLLHPKLLPEVEKVLFSYGATQEWTKETKKRTLFDISIQQQTDEAEDKRLPDCVRELLSAWPK